MPKLPTPKPYVSQSQKLLDKGIKRISEFCKVNDIHCPTVIAIDKWDWHVGACAYYRPQEIKICLAECAHPCTEHQVRNWNWPGSTTDREPYGVVCHELGHHIDWLMSEKKGKYYGDYSKKLHEKTKEKSITSYDPNVAEWFAEICRLYITNHALLALIRPRTWAALHKQFKPVSDEDWVKELGPNVPARVIKALENKMEL